MGVFTSYEMRKRFKNLEKMVFKIFPKELKFNGKSEK